MEVKMTKPRGWIIYNGNFITPKFLEPIESLRNAAEHKNVILEPVKNNELLMTIENGAAVIKGKYKDDKPDFIIFWDKDIRLAYHLEKMGFKLYNCARTIEICDDKTLTYEVLFNNGIPMPKTVIAPMVFEGCKIIDFSAYEYIAAEIGYPMVIKEAFGSFGAQVYLVRNEEQLLQKINEIGGKPYVFQELIASSYGRDIRLNVVGDEVVASMFRRSETDFRANVTAGGKMFAHEPTDEQKELAIRCCKIIGADFAGVDLLFGEDNKPIVCEVNSNAHLKNIYTCTGIEVSFSIIDYIRRDLGVI
jgi:ribosomal protein S6--L-glutamate ligase/gamma-F420-2:alpha-L-glutamate ligase